MIYDMNPYQMPKTFCIGERVDLPAQSPAEHTNSSDVRNLLFCMVSRWRLCCVHVRHVQRSAMAFVRETFSCLVRNVRPT